MAAAHLTLPLWYDLHAHFRQGKLLEPLIRQHLAMGCAGILAMPNTKPPVAKVFKGDPVDGWSIEEYLDMIKAAGGGNFRAVIAPLYLTAVTTPKMIEDGAKKGLLKACKYYPPYGTTNSEFGAAFRQYIDKGVFAAMEANNVALCVHGETHGLKGEAYFGRATNAEEQFYKTEMPELAGKFPGLKIVAEHITTKVAADFVSRSGPNVGATITPQHLLYTTGDLLQGLKYHLYCLPVVKFEEDMKALRKAVTSANNAKFFAGTDSAPHTTKATPCGCAAGCYTGGVAPQLYAEAFEAAGSDPAGEAFKNFLCLNGAKFYALPVPKETFTLTKESQEVGILETPEGGVVPLPLGMLPAPAPKATIGWKVVC